MYLATSLTIPKINIDNDMCKEMNVEVMFKCVFVYPCNIHICTINGLLLLVNLKMNRLKAEKASKSCGGCMAIKI